MTNAKKTPVARNGIVIFDLDNCVVNDQHRIHLIDDSIEGQGKWHEYNMAAPGDSLNDFALPYIQNAREHNMLLAFVTARPIVYQAIAIEQISTLLGLVLGEDFALYMRPENDFRPAPVLKAEIASHLSKMATARGSMVFGAFDDRQDVVDAYNAIGIPAFVLSTEGSDAPFLGTPQPSELDKFAATGEHRTSKSTEVAPDVVDAELVPDGPTRPEHVAEFRPFANASHEVAAVAKALFPNGLPKAIDRSVQQQWLTLENILAALVVLANAKAKNESNGAGAAEDLVYFANRLQKIIKP